MTGFLAVAAVLAALTVLMLLLPLLRREQAREAASRVAINATIYQDQLAELDRDFASGSLTRDDFEHGRRELQRRLLEDASVDDTKAAPPARAGLSALVVGVMVPLAAAVLYFALGNVAALSPQSAPQHVSASDIEGMVAKLAARLEQNPGDPKGWVMLARSYKAMNRYDDAAAAYAKAAALAGDDAQLLADYAETLAVAKGGTLVGAPTEMIQRALKADPNHPQALVLAGTAAYERGEFAAAAAHWDRLRKQLPAESEDAKALATSIAKARAQADAQKKQPAGARK